MQNCCNIGSGTLEDGSSLWNYLHIGHLAFVGGRLELRQAVLKRVNVESDQKYSKLHSKLMLLIVLLKRLADSLGFAKAGKYRVSLSARRDTSRGH